MELKRAYFGIKYISNDQIILPVERKLFNFCNDWRPNAVPILNCVLVCSCAQTLAICGLESRYSAMLGKLFQCFCNF